MNEETATTAAKHTRKIEVVAEATTLDGWKKRVVAGQKGEKQFTFLSDEGSYMPGGEGTAPAPLTYFVSGVAL
jgi:hypothetical protein